MPLILPSQRLIRPNPLSRPAGATPGVDPSHPAAPGLYSFIIPVLGAQALNLAGKAQFGEATNSNIGGTPSTQIDQLLGPSFRQNLAGDYLGFNAPVLPTNTANTGLTFASIMRPLSLAATLVFTSVDSSNLYQGMATTGEFILRLNGVISFASGIFGIVNAPYFWAVSLIYKGSNLWDHNHVVVRLDTGQITATSVVGTSQGPITFTTGLTSYGGAAGFGGPVAMGPSMVSTTALSMEQLVAWAKSPWEFWYPRSTIQRTTPATPVSTTGGAIVRRRWNRPRLAYPAGATPGIDWSHPAARGLMVSLFPGPGGNVINLGGAVGQRQGTILAGPINYGINSIIGPVTTATFGTSQPITFPKTSLGATVPAGTEWTMAAVVIPNTNNGNTVSLNSADVTGSLYLGNDGVNFILRTAGVQTFSSGIPCTVVGLYGKPFFYAASAIYDGTNLIHTHVVVNLLTGQVQTSGPTTTAAAAPADGTNLTFGGNTSDQTLGPGMWSSKALNITQLRQWAADPWSFWYPDKKTQLFTTAPTPPTATTVFIVSGTNYTVPSNCAVASSVECIGGGGNSASIYIGSGGGGGAYSKTASLSLTPGAAITIQVGGAAGDTWFNGVSLAASSVGAKGGATGTNASANAAGGAAASGIGSTKYSGGNGGTTNGGGNGGAGGGGAAGPNGNGAVGGAGTSAYGGTGGGGASGGSAGVADSGTDGTVGGAAFDATAGGAGGAGGGGGAGTDGGVGSHGSGGGGGGQGGTTSGVGGVGGAGIEWDSTHGAGGGGGGGGGRTGGGAGAFGGDGGLYGGGAGGPGYTTTSHSSAGAQGIIVLTYTPLTSVLITSGTTFTVPSDCSTATSVECLGGGGSGATSGGNNAAGGGGGAYSKTTSLSLTPNASVTIQVGGAAGDTWFNGANLAASSVGAKGGADASTVTGGAGGAAASGIGSTKSNGGTGGNNGNGPNSGSGGGGAGGPNGDGKVGGLAGTNGSGGSGGGAGNNGSVGSPDNVSNNGTAGGAAFDATAGGTGGTTANPGNPGNPGSHGSGGGGGGGGAASSGGGDAGAGGAGIEFDSTHGSGGGGGGGGGRQASGGGGTGGAGGLYGAGGGGGGFGSPFGVGGAGAQGAIFLTYTPSTPAGSTHHGLLLTGVG